MSASIEDRLGRGRLGFQDRPIGNLAVPFDQRRNGAAALDHDLEQLPHGVRNRTVMAVDEQQIALVVALLGMAGKVNLADPRERKVGEIVQRREAMIGRGYEDVVDVEQQAAAGPLGDAADEIGLAHRRLAKCDVGRRVFQQDRAPDRFLHLVDVIADVVERRLRCRAEAADR